MKTAFLLSCLLAMGCTPFSTAFPFDASGIAPPHAGYRIPYADSARHRFLSDDWRVANYALDPEDERPLARSRIPTKHLQLAHRRTHASLWVDSVPLPRSMEQTELRVIAENWVASIARSGYYQATIAGATVVVAQSAPTYAAEILDARGIGVHGQPAHAVLLDIANLHQTEISPDERSARALVTFVRMPHRRIIRSGLAVGGEPLLLIVGYVNLPADFEQSMPDYTRFLDSIEFVEDRW